MNIIKLIISVFLLYLLSSCSSLVEEQKGGDKVRSTHPGLESVGVDRKNLQRESDILVQREASIVEGGIKVPRPNGTGFKSYQARECMFSYEKSENVFHRTNKSYQYEMISVALIGEDSKGVSFYDRVSYTNADFENLFVNWDFSESFGPVELDGTLHFGRDDNHGSLTFHRNKDGRGQMELRSTDFFSEVDSHYYRAGEKRDYTILIDFDEISEDHIKLNKIRVKSYSSIRDKFGNFLPSQLVTNTICRSFRE